MGKMVLNAKSIQALKPGPDRADYFDDGRGAIPGLHVRVSPNGEKVYSVLYRIWLGGESKLRRLTLGSINEMTLEKAREDATAARQKAKKGIDPAQQKMIEREAESFADLCETYLKKHASKKRSGDEDRRIIDRYLLPKLKYTRAENIDRATIQNILEDIADNGLDGDPAPVMANRVLSCVRKVFNFGISKNLVKTANPCVLIDPPGGKEKARRRKLDEEERRIVWAAFDTVEAALSEIVAKRMINAFRLRLITAQRGGEIDNARWEHIDLETGWWEMPRSKNEESHRVWLCSVTRRILRQEKERAPEGSPWVFAGRRKDEPIAEVKGVLTLVREEAVSHGLKEHWTLHDLRRTAATAMAKELGVLPYIISRILNHKNPDIGPESQNEITATYNQHTYDEEKKTALDRWAKHLMKGVKGLRAVSTRG